MPFVAETDLFRGEDIATEVASDFVGPTQTARDLMPDHPTRIQIDKRLALMRNIEQDPSTYGFSRYTNDRSGSEYVTLAKGLHASLDHASRIGNGVVLDVGAGTTKAAVDLHEYAIFAGIPLWFEATVLDGKYADLEKRKPFSPSRIHETSVEYLEGIDDESVSMVLGICSIMYSATPELAARRINEVLAPGGVLKTTYAASTIHPIERPSPFLEELGRLGYDIYIKWGSFDGEGYESDDVILGIKPGGEDQISAKELMWRDEVMTIPQLNVMGNQKFNARSDSRR